MLTFEDCLALCDLSVDEIAAIAEHEHLPEMAALGYGEYLIHGPDGEQHIKRMIVEDIERAKTSGNLKHAEELEAVKFVERWVCERVGVLRVFQW